MAAQIQTETKANGRSDELVDVSRAVGRWTEASRTASSDYLDLCEKTVERFADLEVKSAQAIRLPLVATIAETHAAVSRQLAGAYVKAARDLSTPSRRRTITLRDGARATLRPIAPEDRPLIAAKDGYVKRDGHMVDPADHEQDQVVRIARIGHLAWRRRLDV